MKIHDATEIAYKNGYEQGKKDAMASIVHCKDCRYCTRDRLFGNYWCNVWAGNTVKPDDFCSRGELL